RLEAWTEASLDSGLAAWRLQPLAGLPGVRRQLLVALESPVGRRRIAALRGLARQLHQPAIRSRVVGCLADPCPQVCSTAVEILRSFATDPAVGDEFLRLFTSDAPLPGCVHRALRRGLRAAAGEARVQRQLLDALTTRRRPWLAAAALGGARASPELCDQLVALAQDAESFAPVAMWPAFESCAHIPRVTAALLPLLQHRSGTTVQAALRIVGRGTSPEARDAVVRLLEHPDNYVRWLAIQQLEPHVGDPGIETALLARLPHEDESGRSYILTALAPSRSPQVNAVVRAHLADPSPPVAVTAAGALCREQPDDEAWAVLRAHVGPSAPLYIYTAQWQRICPLAVLGRLPELGLVRDALGALLRHQHSGVRVAAIEALRGSPSDADIAGRLATLIGDDAPKVSGAAYETLEAWVDR
ncbi:MAG: hypothetical protein AAF721_18320, partial [Myxococcota bacterium]